MAQQNNAPFETRSNGLAGRVAGALARRRTMWLIVIAWVAVLVVAGPLAAKLTDVEENDAAAWLPNNAESLQVAELQEQYRTDDAEPAMVVYHRDGGLTAADLATVNADRAELTALFPDTPATEPIVSEDGAAAFFIVPFVDAVDGDEDAVANAVETIREQVDAGGGLSVNVTGPAGFGVDFDNAFSGIDSTLLIATASVVTLLLLITYRSPFLWIVPLLAVAFAHQTAGALVYLLAEYADVTVNGQSSGVLPVLVFGAGTDYALLLIARYREELRRHESKYTAMARALRQAGPAILASGGTVIIGLLCLLAATLNSNRSLGPVGAAGILAALVAMLTLLPALLLIFGRRIFWPFTPRVGSVSNEESNLWARVGRWVERRPRAIWITVVLALALLATGILGMDSNLGLEDQFVDEPDSITGQKIIAASFPAGSAAPNTIVANSEATDAVVEAALATPGIAAVEVVGALGEQVELDVIFEAAPGTSAAFDTVEALRANVHAVPGAGALVGGEDAVGLDTAEANSRDRMIVMPLVLTVVLIILGLLLRAVIVPLMLTATVVISYAAALGFSALVFEYVFGFAALEGSMPLLAFVFLVALGIDYNIFLMSRVHEESEHIGTHRGMLKGLSVTGGVITSAGLVLAATFAVLTALPLVPFVQIGFIVAFGVLLDTLIVRSILVPALTLDIGKRIWWPSALARRAPATTPAGALDRREPAIEVGD